ncbi:MAG: hypothetical protein IT381_29335 [Deltaproteobacteria bacterium]|nr:hypothetical protein [Deltaproteobacteria bacterium]
MKRLISADTVTDAFAAGVRVISAPVRETIVTPEARAKAMALGVEIDHAGKTTAQTPDAGSCERVVDPSGVIVVRGQSVKLGRFATSADRSIALTDVITSSDGSPMAAGIMSFTRDQAFAWTLQYDEIDLVLEGTLHITIAGRTVEGGCGDVLYIPKGSAIVFGTPSRARVFYVTHPADWATKPTRPST